MPNNKNYTVSKDKISEDKMKITVIHLCPKLSDKERESVRSGISEILASIFEKYL